MDTRRRIERFDFWTLCLPSLVRFVAEAFPDLRRSVKWLAHQYEYLLGAVAMMVIAVMTWRSKPIHNPTKIDEQ
jgi:hypothetical protein